MIIKKRKNNDNNNINNNTNDNNTNNIIENFEYETKNTEPKIEPVINNEENIFDVMTVSSERQERRRGDRRRGYRRIEDRSLVTRAQEEAKLIKEKAEEDGFQSGLSKAENEITLLQQSIAAILEVQKDAYEYYKSDIIEIALNVAEKILNAHVKADPDTIVEIAENVIKDVSKEESKITFIINPEDSLTLCESLENNSAFNNKRATMSVQTDKDIQKGSCKVVTNSGQIDATFVSQLNIIRKAFKEGM